MSCAAGLDFAYPEATKLGGMVSGPPQQGAGTSESPSGWLIAVERWEPPSSPAAPAAGDAAAAKTSGSAQPAEGGANAAGEDAEEASVGSSGQAGTVGSDGQVVRQLVWGGCAGLVLRGAVSIEPLIAQACPPTPQPSPVSHRYAFSHLLPPLKTPLTHACSSDSGMHAAVAWQL